MVWKVWYTQHRAITSCKIHVNWQQTMDKHTTYGWPESIMPLAAYCWWRRHQDETTYCNTQVGCVKGYEFYLQYMHSFVTPECTWLCLNPIHCWHSVSNLCETAHWYWYCLATTNNESKFESELPTLIHNDITMVIILVHLLVSKYKYLSSITNTTAVTWSPQVLLTV